MASRTFLTPAAKLCTLKTFAPTTTTAVAVTAARLLNTSSVAHQSTVATTSSNPPGQKNLTLGDKIALRFRNYLPNTTETYVAYEVTRELYNECAQQAAYISDAEQSVSAKFWYETCGRTPSFQTWGQVTMLHMWMLTTRMRAFQNGRSQASIWKQHFIDHFFYNAEEMMVKQYGVKSATQRRGYMKDLFHQYRGLTAAMDEGLMKGDAVLASAIWRNTFDASDNVDIEVLAMVTSHVRRVLSKLGQVGDEIVLTGRVKFGLPDEELKVVRKKGTFLEE